MRANSFALLPDGRRQCERTSRSPPALLLLQESGGSSGSFNAVTELCCFFCECVCIAVLSKHCSVRDISASSTGHQRRRRRQKFSKFDTPKSKQNFKLLARQAHTQRAPFFGGLGNKDGQEEESTRYIGVCKDSAQISSPLASS